VSATPKMGTGEHEPNPREDVQHMKMMRKASLTLAAAMVSVGAIGISVPAHADTNWPCSACLRTGHR
jgi:hypothetical protein